MACKGAKKATVEIEGRGKIVSKNPEVEVDVKPPGGVKITLAGTGVRGDWVGEYLEIDYTDAGGTANDKYTLKTENCTLEIGCGAASPNPDHGAFVQARIFKNGKELHRFVPMGWYGVGVKSIKKIKAELTITDETGVIHKEEFDETPKYSISCDDDCPEGYIKGHSDRPPGYCCLPCEEVRSQLNTIKAMLGG
jgi:hypothetical protein